ncbi:DNA methyltransferase [Brachyspira hyodysenteriae]|uniref:DNA methyltransferase n=1 Tax=Brachyspira hyodysenteriae TaxID=159 RepID=UPI000699F0CC|nr:DNA methyltransferase [Brachyspira hyodysenteriae]
MEYIHNYLKKLFKKNNNYIGKDGDLLISKIAEDARLYNSELIKFLFNDKRCKDYFFEKIDDVTIFKSEDFRMCINDARFLGNSFTKYGNKIGLITDRTVEKIMNEDYVVLSYPYKDCTLDGGMTKTEAKRTNRKETMINNILFKEDIHKLKSPKAFKNFKKYSFENGKVKEETPTTIKGNENIIINGNNFAALCSLKEKFAGKIKLIYIDPPYNTGSDTFSYNDNFNHSSWLVFMKDRLQLARELLSDDGSIYINIDYNEVHYLKVLMDEIFGRDNFQREIIWRIGWISGYKTSVNNYIRNHDTILFYSKTNNYTFNKYYNTINDFVNRFNDKTLDEIKIKLLKYNIPENELKEFIEFIKYVGLPEKYPLEDTWNSSIYDKLNSIAVVSFSGEKISKLLNTEEFRSQKSEALLKRIIDVSSNENDIILDFFAGSGTTLAVAHKMNRRYIGVEQIQEHFDICVERIKKVIEGENSGISKNVNWQGGGEFITFDIASYNADWAEKIKKIKDDKELKKIFEDMKDKSLINHRLQIDYFENKSFEDDKEFLSLDLERKKEILLELLDKNMFYVPFSEMKDKTFKLSDDDIKLSKQFYKN